MLTIMMGISGSGKTTYARGLPGVRVSRDDIRRELTGRTDKFVGDNGFEIKVSKTQEARVRTLLLKRQDVIIDDTNLKSKYVRKWIDMARDYGHPYRVIPLSVSLETALERNENRSPADKVHPSVIHAQHLRFGVYKSTSSTHPFVDWSRYVPDRYAPTAYMVDIDGTLANNTSGLSPYDPRHYPLDERIDSVFHVIAQLELKHTILLMSGRDEKDREVTEKWLATNAVTYDALFMRPDGDNRRDDVVKVDLFNHNIRDDFNVLGAFDDRLRVCRAWYALGVPVFRVGNPDADF